MRFPLVLAAMAVLAMPLAAATRTWTGSAGGNWNVALNWDALPAAGDDLVLPAVAVTFATNNDFPAGTQFHSLQIDGAGYSISGNAIAIGAGGITSGFSATISAPLQLAAGETWTSNGGTLTTGNLALNGFTVTLDAQAGDGDLGGTVTGSGGIVKTGPGDWRLAGPSSTYTGMVTVNAGRLIAAGVDALGFGGDTPANGTVVNSGGTLVFNGVPISSEHLTISGSGHLGNGVLQSPAGATQYGTTVLADNTVAMNILGSLVFEGRVTGPGLFGMGGDGSILLANSGNDFIGPVVWGTTGTAQTNLGLLGHNAIPPTHSIVVPADPGAIFNVNGFTQSLTSLNGNGPVSLGTGGVLTLTDTGGIYRGTISGSGTLVVAGGMWTMTGASTWTGTLSHTAGTLGLDEGSIAADFEQSGGSFALNGSVAGSVTITGGNFTPGRTATSGSLSTAAFLYQEYIISAAPGDYGSMTVTGTVSLAGQLNVDVIAGSPYPPGTTFTIIDNDGSDPVTGTFTGLPEGAMVVDGERYTISYAGGTGNDVVLTALPVRPDTVTTLTAAPNPSRFGAPVTITATVTSDAGTPEGSVFFYDYLTFLGEVPLVNGTATLTIDTLAAGTHQLYAHYDRTDFFELSVSGIYLQAVAGSDVPALDARALIALAALLAVLAAGILGRAG